MVTYMVYVKDTRLSAEATKVRNLKADDEMVVLSPRRLLYSNDE